MLGTVAICRKTNTPPTFADSVENRNWDGKPIVVLDRPSAAKYYRD
jgi:hypothetical protein